MKTITIQIKSNEERIKILEILQNNNYKADIKIKTEYMPPRYTIQFSVQDYEVN